MSLIEQKQEIKHDLYKNNSTQFSTWKATMHVRSQLREKKKKSHQQEADEWKERIKKKQYFIDWKRESEGKHWVFVQDDDFDSSSSENDYSDRDNDKDTDKDDSSTEDNKSELSQKEKKNSSKT
ncbi:uncharacterized protein MONOS_18276 [Monocercomonoides exilis]|uniref:uncharacterized protein n=1 Tax=Monocercomonoides exilis TaxID=2049356 RepID=UPI00355A4998|nr:hypothetical protein MONOS_18276 [Monocercomonoides exilis]